MRSIRTFPYEYQLSLREKVIAYPDDCRAVRKAYRNIAQQRRAEAFQHSCRWFKPICSDHVREARECRFS